MRERAEGGVDSEGMGVPSTFSLSSFIPVMFSFLTYRKSIGGFSHNNFILRSLLFIFAIGNPHKTKYL
jgi:hypothetical protein